MKWILCLLVFAISCNPGSNEQIEPQQTQPDSWESLKNEAGQLGKDTWRPMLEYVANLHQKSTHPASYPFDYDWEEIGPGYVYGPAFGHWDIVHQIIDVLPSHPTHALNQLYNELTNELYLGDVEIFNTTPLCKKPELKQVKPEIITVICIC